MHNRLEKILENLNDQYGEEYVALSEEDKIVYLQTEAGAKDTFNNIVAEHKLIYPNIDEIEPLATLIATVNE